MLDRITGKLILSELILGEIIYGILAQIVILFTDKILYYSGGLWIGIVSAVIMAIHMDYSINRALDYDEGSAIKIVRKDSIIRYFSILLVFGLLMYTNLLSPIVAFIGVISLKAGAYMQPIVHKSLRKIGPKKIREFILADDEYRKQLLKEYEEEQARKEAEKLAKQ